MTEAEILTATGNQWRVYCSGRKGENRTVFVRADTRAKAEQIGREMSGMRCARASAYQPWADPEMRGFVKVMEAK